MNTPRRLSLVALLSLASLAAAAWRAEPATITLDPTITLAAAGTVDRGRVARFGEHLFFARVPPKSLDRGDFNDAWTEGLSVADGAATLRQNRPAKPIVSEQEDFIESVIAEPAIA